MADERLEPLGDAALVAAARAGDKAAFAALIGHHRRVLVGLCARMLGDAALGEDAAQEATLRALVDLDRLREPQRFGAWLAGIGLNVCRQWLREAARRPGSPLAEIPVDPAPGPADAVAAAEEAERVRAAVAALPPGQRTAVTDFYLRGLSHAELAATLGVSVGAVKTRLHKARARLRQRLAAFEEERTMTEDTIALRVAYLYMPPLQDQARRQPYVVVLQEVGGNRLLPIWIGEAEARSLALTLEDIEVRRPTTYQFATRLLAAAGSDVAGCRVTRLEEGTFYAVVEVDGPRGRRQVDARTSDALNLALLAGAPISTQAAVLEAVRDSPGYDDWPTAEEAAARGDPHLGADKVLAAYPDRGHPCGHGDRP